MARVGGGGVILRYISILTIFSFTTTMKIEVEKTTENYSFKKKGGGLIVYACGSFA